MQTRRDLAKSLIGTPLAVAFARNAFGKVDSKINGVMVGAQSYSFRDRSLDEAIKAYQEIGLGYVELWQGHIEPKDKAELKKWRTSVPESEIRAVRKKFDAAGLNLYAINISFRDDFSDEEIEHGFRIAQWLGLNKITASSNVSTAKRIDPFAKKYKIYVGMHNHGNIKPNEFATPENFAEAMDGKSKYIAVNLDIGHATAAGWDPVEYLKKNHSRILTLHIKDRTPNQGEKRGDNLPFGKGTTKIKEVLQLLKTKKYAIPAMIEYEYGKKGSSDAVADVKECFAYCKQALA